MDLPLIQHMSKLHPHTADRGPLKTMFLLTSMPVGGAETLLVNLIRRLDRERFQPELACLKGLDELGEVMSKEVTTTKGYLSHKFDLRVLPRLTGYLKQRQVDVLVTIGAGDKMFWGRLAGWLANTPAVVSALHSTGWPDGVGRLNRMLTPITDAFVAVAAEHGRYLSAEGGFPAHKVRVIPNGVDTDRFRRDIVAGSLVREELGIPLDAQVCGIVAALRPEKNHELFLRAAEAIRQRFAESHFLIVGDGAERQQLETITRELGLQGVVHFVGTRSDVHAVLAAMDCMLLTSKMEANPVSILEALAVQVPVVATRVGSVSESVIDNQTGFLVAPGSVEECADRVSVILDNLELAERLGRQGRALVETKWSVDRMVEGYETLLSSLYNSKAQPVTRSTLPPTKRGQKLDCDTEDLVSV